MKVDLFAHPVSFRADPAGQAERIAATGADGVVLALAYHSGRWLLTTSDPGAVTHLDAGRFFHDDNPDLLGQAVVEDTSTTVVEALRSAGLDASGWLVGLHQSAIATDRPDLALRNAFGHRYRHALCPARPEVVAFARALVAGAARTTGVSRLELEAFGYLGWAHQGAHEKVGTALRPADQWLLSLCVCSACRVRFSASGVDPDELTGRVTTAVRAQLSEPRPPASDLAEDIDSALGRQLHQAVLSVRSGVSSELVAAAVDAAGSTPVSVRATADPHGCTGKTAGGLADLAATGAGLTVTDLSGDFDALQRELEAAAAVATHLTVGWSLFHSATPTSAVLGAVTDLAVAHGADALALYLYDLVPAARLRDLPTQRRTSALVTTGEASR
ncbi:hypothetical protein BBK82_31105 [Lentzea guizhouensis]|uniref:Alanine-rich protein n=1 Tax=Lentzea guizhouensis TaxID=1586287 RepID=A0A1B2HQ29_9PSEU|nr:hypothetical protein [Lentzea guizhouensis]ANZ39834.1 hypothetical protein BBK82_31105 [Lentzea guizhouensis]